MLLKILLNDVISYTIRTDFEFISASRYRLYIPTETFFGNVEKVRNVVNSNDDYWFLALIL
jgi:hypothetical protein